MSKFLSLCRIIIVSALFIGTVARAEHSAWSALRALPFFGIIEGRDAKVGEYPGVAKLYRFTIEGEKVLNQGACSAVVIEGCIVTSSHCFAEEMKTEFIRFPDGSVHNLKRGSLRRLSLETGPENKGSGVDIAVVRLESVPKEHYGIDTLTDEKFVDWEGVEATDLASYRRVKGKGASANLVAFGSTFSFAKESARINSLPPEKREEEAAVLKKRVLEELGAVRKQVGNFEVLGPMDVVAFAENLRKATNIRKALEAQDESEERTEQLAQITEIQKLLSAHKAYIGFGTPSSAADGDSGGPVFAKDKKGVERLVGIAETGSEDTRTIFSPVFENREWLVKQLEELGCAGKPAPPKSFSEMK